jgi:hypothetical protein
MAVFKLKVQDMDEDVGQIALVKWLKLMKIPVIHIPNEGKRSFATARWLESMGMYRGAADLFIARVRIPFGGYWIEMKKKGKKPTELQAAFLDKMKVEGYYTGWFDDWILAKESIEKYLDSRF